MAPFLKNGTIPNDENKNEFPLVHGSGDFPEGAGGLSLEHYEVLYELREGARMHRDWPVREGREVTPTPSKYREITPESTLEWKPKARWKTITFDAPERELAVRDIGFRAEQPMNSAAYKERRCCRRLCVK